MHGFIDNFKRNLIGYAVLSILVGIAFYTDLVMLLLLFFYIYLLTDVVSAYARKWVPFIPSSLIIWTVYFILITVFAILIFKIVPLFFKDSANYFALIIQDTKQLLIATVSKYSIPIDLSMIQEKVFDDSAKYIGSAINIFNNISKMIIYFIFALVLNFLLYHEKKRIECVFTCNNNSLLSYLYNFILLRIIRFYTYFRKVMGAQVIISLINTSITAVLINILHLPHQITLLCLVFFFGLIPVIGNLVSNTILTITTLLSTGIVYALVCLVFLVGIHKLEYFLNSKIVGSVINLPMFIILLSLLLGETLLGIWGFIIAVPFVLTLRDEMETPLNT